MLVKKVLNNCVILAQDEHQQEVILMGNAIGYHYKTGDELPRQEIDKTFVSLHPSLNTNFLRVLQDTPLIYVDLCTEIIEYGKAHLDVTISDSIYVTLIDHINFVMQRYKENLRLQNRLYWDIKRQYPKEFAIGEYACRKLDDCLQIDLWKEEAANIALHFINAQHEDQTMEHTIMIADTLHDVLLIISRHFQLEFDVESLDYSRLITHLQFFIIRMIRETTLASDDDFLYDQIKIKYADEVSCVMRIEEYVMKKWNHPLEHDEIVYLCIHIHRVIQHIR